MSPSIVIAPDSFKGSLSAREVAEAIAAGWREVRPGDAVTLIPQADGGEGTLDAIESAVAGSVRRSAGMVTGPDGRPTPGEWLQLPSGGAVVELAQASGLPLMGALDPLAASTRGLGEVVGAALDAGATSLVIGLGGSASTDGGAGALAALGLRLVDDAGSPLPDGGAALARLASVDRTALLPAPAGGVVLLTDVTAPLLGDEGAAAVFGPQKGATRADVPALEHGLRRLARFLPADPDAPGAGAAGGTGFGLLGWGAEMAPGSAAVGLALGLPDAIATADLVITGEGRYDSQSAAGKVPGHVAALAAASGTEAALVAGGIQASTEHFTAARSLVDLAGALDAALAEPLRWLSTAGAELAAAL